MVEVTEKLKALLGKKGMNSVDQLVDSYENLERGFSERVKIPGQYSTQADIEDFHKKLGRPESVSGYGIDNSVMGDDVLKAMFKNGVSTNAAKELEGVFTSLKAAEIEANNSARLAAVNEIKTKHGDDALDAGMKAFKNAMTKVGIDESKSESIMDSFGVENALSIGKVLNDSFGESKVDFGKSFSPSMNADPIEALLDFDRKNNNVLKNPRSENYSSVASQRASLAKAVEERLK